MLKVKKIIDLVHKNANFYAPVLIAQPAPLDREGPIVPPPLDDPGVNNIIGIVQAVIQFIIVVAFVIAFIMLLVGGIRWILAGGDEKAVANARSTITAALIGLVVVLIAFALIRLVETFFGIPILSGGVCIPTVKQLEC
ncbi:MAG: pilin [Candidatus Curtissbacteria bacterium]|nr:pilin [Candidatus Curtissbacteria bacterium]